MSIIEQTDNIHLKWGIFVENKYYTAPSSKEAYLISNHTGSGEILGPGATICPVPIQDKKKKEEI